MRLIQYTPKLFEDSLKGRKPVPQSIVPLDRGGRRYWKLLADDDLTAHAVWRCGWEINSRKKLEQTDLGLYQVLRRRGLLDDVGLPDSNDGHRNWAEMGKEELIAHAKGFIAGKGISRRGMLEKVDCGLHAALRMRNLWNEVGLPDLRGEIRDWEKIGRDGLAAYAKEFIAKNGITKRRRLAEADPGLYSALRKRKLLDEVGLPDSNDGHRNWAEMGKEELIAHAKGFIVERGIQGRKELAKADKGLYQALGKRKLLDEVGLADSRGERRDWAGMGKEELVAHAKEFIAENGIGGRGELEKADAGLYNALRKRKLLDEVFSDAESSKHADAVNGVLGALDSFGDDE
ncbi:MAG: hypothetical protein V1861_06475 [Candidatus Micrarchaeota archaeon]